MSQRTLALALVLMLSTIGPVMAQEPSQGEQSTDFDREIEWPEFPDPAEDAPVARIAVYFDPVGRSRMLSPEPNEPFEFYLVAHDPHVAVLAWEVSLQIDEGVTIIEEDLLGGMNLGGDGLYRVGLLPENCHAGAQVELARFRAIVTDPSATDVVIRLGPVQGPSLSDPPRPAYATCRENAELRPFLWDEIAAVVNPVDVRIESEDRSDDLFAPQRGR